MSLQYCLYISDAKIDMLLQQIDPGFARKRVSEVGVSPKFISAKRTVEDPGSERDMTVLLGSPLFVALAD
jgi:hypothetical protein